MFGFKISGKPIGAIDLILGKFKGEIEILSTHNLDAAGGRSLSRLLFRTFGVGSISWTIGQLYKLSAKMAEIWTTCAF